MLTISNIGACLLLGLMSLSAESLEEAIGIFTFFPAILGSILGGIAHRRNWLKHPILVPLICGIIFLMIAFTTISYENNWYHSLYLTLALSLAGLRIAIGTLDNKGYLVPLILSLIFQSYYRFVFAALSPYTALYLLSGYSGLFIGRFWKHRRADKLR